MAKKIMVYYFLSITFKKHFKPCFFILEALLDILQHLKFVNWWFRFFDVTNKLFVKGQLTSKWLNGVIDFLKKTNERI